jgi:hypothetical protein
VDITWIETIMGSWDTGILWNSIHPSHQPCPGGFHQPNHQPQLLGVLNDLPPFFPAQKRLQWDLFQNKPLEVSSMHHRPRNWKIWLFFLNNQLIVSKIKVRKKEQHTNRDAELCFCNQKPICKTSHWNALKASPLNECPMPMSHTVPIILCSWISL